MEPQAIQPEASAKGKGKGQVIAGRKTDLWKKPRGTGRQEIKEDSEVSKARQEKKEDSEVPKAKQEPGRDTTQENLKKPRTDQRESG